MAEDWVADVKKYVPNADDGVVAGIVRYCGIALHNRDSSLVSFAEREEVARVRKNFLRKKLGLTDSDEELDRAIAAVGDTMKADKTRNRVTVYYLLAEHFDKLSLFAGSNSKRSGGAAQTLGSAPAPTRQSPPATAAPAPVAAQSPHSAPQAAAPVPAKAQPEQTAHKAVAEASAQAPSGRAMPAMAAQAGATGLSGHSTLLTGHGSTMEMGLDERRKTYARFLNLIKFAGGAVAITLILLFLFAR